MVGSGLMEFVWFASAALLILQQAVTQPVPRADYLKVMDAEYDRMDANHDGRVTAQEAAAKLAQDERQRALTANRQIFARLDKDRNGSLSPEEFAGLIAVPPIDPAPFMQRTDLNHDGIVTLVEHRTATLATFDGLDADKDGVVTPAEMEASQQAAAKR
jgi:Ca2+-binding EF-hand superfamily protein